MVDRNNKSDHQQLIDLLAEVWVEAGPDSEVVCIPSEHAEFTWQVCSIFRFEQGYLSYEFPQPPGSAGPVLPAPRVLLSARRLQEPDVEGLSAIISRGDLPLLLVAPDYERRLMGHLIQRAREGVPLCAVRSPGFGSRREAVLGDLAAVLTARVVGDGSRPDGSLEAIALGTARTAVVKADRTILVDPAGLPEGVRSRMKGIQREMNMTTSDYDREKLSERVLAMQRKAVIVSVPQHHFENGLASTSEAAWRGAVKSKPEPAGHNEVCGLLRAELAQLMAATGRASRWAEQDSCRWDNARLAQLIVEVFAKVGVDGGVMIRCSGACDTTIDWVEGCCLSGSRLFASPQMPLSEDLLCNPSPGVLVYSVLELADALESVASEPAAAPPGAPLVVVCSEYSEGDLARLPSIDRVCSAGVLAFALERSSCGAEMIEDLRILAGQGEPDRRHLWERLGKGGFFLASKEGLLLADTAGGVEAIKRRTAHIRMQLEVAVSEIDRKLLEHRLARIAGGVAMVDVGGRSRIEALAATERLRAAFRISQAQRSELMRVGKDSRPEKILRGLLDREMPDGVELQDGVAGAVAKEQVDIFIDDET